VVELTAQLWLHIPISFVTAREEVLKRMTTDAQPFAIPVTRRSTRAKTYPRLRVLKHGKRHTAKLLAGYLKTAT
jgi:hypothetical protein